ncbi:hypothetical protein LM77097_420036 [Listeria monocytogenes]|nr:hypothetical protein LM7423_270003 [Listeria monocytogenes]CUL45465.1 hypothetical protein LM7424_280003 [Listeria monocytogenes]CUL51265.1 hypothetical protein LM77097_420036 [Listeria monocytogenes]CUL88752.1 hypothetical protein LM7425_270003 [Listeria monocytogenes]
MNSYGCEKKQTDSAPNVTTFLGQLKKLSSGRTRHSNPLFLDVLVTYGIPLF